MCLFCVDAACRLQEDTECWTHIHMAVDTTQQNRTEPSVGTTNRRVSELGFAITQVQFISTITTAYN